MSLGSLDFLLDILHVELPGLRLDFLDESHEPVVLGAGFGLGAGLIHFGPFVLVVDDLHIVLTDGSFLLHLECGHNAGISLLVLELEGQFVDLVEESGHLLTIAMRLFGSILKLNDKLVIFGQQNTNLDFLWFTCNERTFVSFDQSPHLVLFVLRELEWALFIRETHIVSGNDGTQCRKVFTCRTRKAFDALPKMVILW